MFVFSYEGKFGIFFGGLAANLYSFMAMGIVIVFQFYYKALAPPLV